MRSRIPVITLLFLLTGCQALRGPDMQATLQAQGMAYVAEATVIAQTAAARQNQIQATVDAAGTQVAETNSVNQQLLATARVLIPPTPAREIGSAPEVAGSPMPLSGSNSETMTFTNTVVTASINEADGCPNGLQNQFLQNADRIYVTTRASSIRAGTVMGVEWRDENQVVFSDNWTISRDATDFCIWYYITPDDVEFRPGRWSVQLSADGAVIEPAVSFVIASG